MHRFTKYSISIFFLFISIVVFPQKNRLIDTTGTISQDFKVINIQRIRHAYVITAISMKDSLYYDIVSLYCHCYLKHKIKLGDIYSFKLIPYYKENMTPDLGTLLDIQIGKKTILVPAQSWTGNVYTTPNLKGLYFVDT